MDVTLLTEIARQAPGMVGVILVVVIFVRHLAERSVSEQAAMRQITEHCASSVAQVQAATSAALELLTDEIKSLRSEQLGHDKFVREQLKDKTKAKA